MPKESLDKSKIPNYTFFAMVSYMELCIGE